MKKILLTLLFVSYINVNAQTPIQEFNFDGNLNNTDNTTSFVGTGNFVNDRNGIVKGAQRLANKGMEAVIDNLPQNNKSRTVSVWVKFNDIASANYIWGYGTAYNAQYCGLLQQGTDSSKSDLRLTGWGAANDVIVSTTLLKDVWYQYSITFDGTTSKIYRNGELLKAMSGVSRFTKGNIFRLGEINTTVGVNADIDDLKIYNIALTNSQVLELYTNSKPLSNAVLKKTVVEKPVEKASKSITAIKTNSAGIISAVDSNVLKNVEVFSKGEKVIGSKGNGMTITDLPEGTYLLKITNIPSKKITSN
ncbi:MAG: LamG domain-containing protein [Flavobacterium sp.]